MIVLMENVSNPRSGKGNFLVRLKLEMHHQGVRVVHDPKQKHDVSLHCIRMWCKTSRPRILRLDGIYHNLDQDYRGKNAPIAESVRKADGVICQSRFGQEMAVRYVGLDPKKSVIISNGAPIVDGGIKRDIILTASRWRPHKRLQDTIEAYLESGETTPLYVAGDVSNAGLKGNYRNNDRIKFIGQVNQEKLSGLYNRAKAFVHLCWFDCCPNSVVEAIAHYCPVITNNVGGTRELIKICGGFALPIDREYDYKPVHLYDPPPIDHSLIAKAIQATVRCNIEVTPRHIDIKNIASKYIKYMKRFA